MPTENKHRKAEAPAEARQPSHAEQVPAYLESEALAAFPAIIEQRDKLQAKVRELQTDVADLLRALLDLYACHRAFSSNDNWTVIDDDAREQAEKAIARQAEKGGQS